MPVPLSCLLRFDPLLMEGAFSGVSLWLRDLLRSGLGGIVPAEDVRLSSPAQKQDTCRVGVCLYDIQDYSHAVAVPAPGAPSLYPPLAMELAYLIYINEEAVFGDFRPEEEQALLSRAAELVSGGPSYSQAEGCPAVLRFTFLSVEEKLKLWQGFSRPIQPALYLEAAPVLLHKQRLQAPAVQQRDYHIRHKEGTP